MTGEEDIMIMTISGVLIRMQVEGISTTGRNTQGVRLIRLQQEEKVATIAKVDPETELDEVEQTIEDTEN
ncbi:DNA gyrase subunit A [Gracilibacillus boraciitolerans JCM 21714]|uniref:DNA gyrase subunit A n=1 Tax=Gracilibacillus boraciitolerans JCM 21714 TaxID=1298598 RepID=W4VLW8_9BACI|nr:DNA gyrase subunit A [Gracilibacillus boraciitolerans JCM 21714]